MVEVVKFKPEEYKLQAELPLVAVPKCIVQAWRDQVIAEDKPFHFPPSTLETVGGKIFSFNRADVISENSVVHLGGLVVLDCHPGKGQNQESLTCPHLENEFCQAVLFHPKDGFLYPSALMGKLFCGKFLNLHPPI